MSKFLRYLAVLLLVSLTTISYAQQVLETHETAKQATQIPEADPLPVKQAPEVGKHVMANTDAGSMILSLLMVLALIFISALVLKRFNFTQQNTSQLKVIASLSLGVKERLVVAQVGEQQLVLGVTPQQITLIKSLEEPIVSSQPEKTSALTGNVLAFLQKNHFNNKNK
ncbi:flagellar biosynthetic protein FliO [Candidatus Colwellia aromaticivorans]|uniref:flagellar biosynthetic protein FliO n=1 Tax=Candidatus Colwellia aromaticivorans TaxID=2267621 RepID=UPI001B349E4B|nr:flagellar biosynthetic protein FliO [Candidatus Colwellia aromaticivorans]